MPELRDEWNLKATTINDSVKNQLESTGFHAPWMRTEWRVFYFVITYWQFQYVLTPAQLAACSLANHSHSEIFEQKRDRSQSTYPMLCLHNTTTFDEVSSTISVAWAGVHRLPSPRGALRKRRTCTRDKKDKALTLKTKQDHEHFFPSIILRNMSPGQRWNGSPFLLLLSAAQSNQVRHNPITLRQSQMTLLITFETAL